MTAASAVSRRPTGYNLQGLVCQRLELTQPVQFMAASCLQLYHYLVAFGDPFPTGLELQVWRFARLKEGEWEEHLELIHETIANEYHGFRERSLARKLVATPVVSRLTGNSFYISVYQFYDEKLEVGDMVDVRNLYCLYCSTGLYGGRTLWADSITRIPPPREEDLQTVHQLIQT